ncbi:MAG: phage distal tail protein [Coriobacteriia bacterium]
MGEVISWIDSANVETILSRADNYEILRGRRGAFNPPISFVEEEVPLQPGSRMRQVKVLPRDVDLPILIRGTDVDDVRYKIAGLLELLDPERGAGKLRVKAGDGTQLDLNCYHSGGLEGDEGGEVWGPDWCRAVISFRAVDPFWYQTYPESSRYSIGDASPFLPLLPLNIAPSTLFVPGVVINNPGQVETWPVWTIVGPGSDITLQNETTGESIVISITLGALEELEIDTRPGYKTVRHGDGTNAYDHLSATSSLWPLVKGNNTVNLTMGAAGADSALTLSFTPRFLSVRRRIS